MIFGTHSSETSLASRSILSIANDAAFDRPGRHDPSISETSSIRENIY